MKKPAKISLRQRATAAIWVSVFGLAIGACWYFLAGERANGPALALMQPPPANAAVSAVRPAAIPATAADAQYKSAERFQLTGVIGGHAGQGVALISLDGQAAQPFAVGTQVAPGYVLHSVSEGRAMLAERTDLSVKLNLYLTVPKTATTSVPSTVMALKAGEGAGSATAAMGQAARPDARVGGASIALSAAFAGPPPRMDSRYRLPVSRRPIPN